MKITNAFLAMVVAVGFSTQAFAKGGGSGITFIPSIAYNTFGQELKNGGTTTKSEFNQTGLTAKLGYTMDMGFYLGGAYVSYATDQLGSTDDNSFTGFGASVGFMKNGFNLIASYLLSASGSDNDSPKTEYTGSGMQVDIGYSFMFGSWGFGPQISYTSWTFDEVKSGGTVVAGMEASITTVAPAIQFMFFF